MKTRVRQVIAVTLLATALASDRALAIAVTKVERVPENRNLVTKLSQHLRRAVVGVKIQLVRLDQVEFSSEPGAPVVVRSVPNFRSGLLSLSTLYLPPPVL